MKISVIMPTYNDSKTIIEAINSVISQTYKNWELIIVDDGSIDETANIVKKIIEDDNRIRYVYQQNADQLNALLNGIQYLTGDIITVFHSDDLIYSDFIFQHIADRFLEQKIDALVGELVCFNEKTEDLRRMKPNFKKFNLKKLQKELLILLGTNLINDVFYASKEYFISNIVPNYIEWNTPFWADIYSRNYKANIFQSDMPILSYRIGDNYTSSDLGRLNVFNGTARTVVRLSTMYKIPLFSIQRFMYRFFRKIGIKNMPIFSFNDNTVKKRKILLKTMKEFNVASNLYTEALISFYTTNRVRTIIISELPDVVYKGKDMRVFNKLLLNNDLPKFYINLLNEMKNGFNKVIVSNESDIEIMSEILEFLNIRVNTEVSTVN